MGFLNDMSHKNCDAKAIFLSDFGDLSVSHGVEGGHAVVSGQRECLEETRWLICMSGALAGMSGRLGSAGTTHQSTYMLPLQCGGHR